MKKSLDDIKNFKGQSEKSFKVSEEFIQSIKEELEIKGYIVTEEGLKNQFEKGLILKVLYKRYPYEKLKLIETAPGKYELTEPIIVGRFPYENLKLVEVAPNRFEWQRGNPHKLFTERDWQEMSYAGLLRTMLKKRP